MVMTRALPLGLDVGSDRVCVAALRQQRDGILRVESVASRKLHVRGQAEEDGTVAAAISEAIRETGSRVRQCVLSVASRDVVLQNVRFAGMSSSERMMAAQFETSRFVPWDIERIPTIVRVVPVTDGSSYIVAAVHASIVRRRADLVRSVGLRPVAIDCESFAATRAFVSCDAVIDIGRNDARLYGCGAPYGTIARIDIGGESLTAALQAALSIDRDAAERRKRSVGMGGVASVALEDLVTTVVAELRHLQARKPIKHVALIGNGWRIEGFPEKLVSAAGIMLDCVCPFELDPEGHLDPDVSDWALAASLSAWAC
jgi:type IV pilus assembly protein PilM